MKSSEYLLRIANAELERKLASTMPAPESIPARDHVLANLEVIKRARDAGWSIKQIHAELEACGVNIEFNTFRKYVSDYAPIRKLGLMEGGSPSPKAASVLSPLHPVIEPPQEESRPSFSSRFRSAGLP